MSKKSSHTFPEIYLAVLDAWPKNIDISDGVITSKDLSDPEDKDGGYFPTLSKTWRQVEDFFEGHVDWYDLMAWTMFGILHESAIRQKYDGKLTIKVESILEKKLVEVKYFKQLAEGGWYPNVPERC